tara:strand:+ start:12167 stop:12601 length:435 start_codon:yes stop_codon:yes gene_type:complete
MIRLLPTSEEQTFSIIPRRKFNGGITELVERVDSQGGTVELNDCVYLVSYLGIKATIREDGTGTSQSFTDVKSIQNNDYIDISISSNILLDERSYVLEITQDNVLWYRDKIYVTSQTNTDIYHTISTDYYEENDTDGDDKYITI